MGRVTSLNFLALAVLLHRLDYPWYVVLGLVVQWILSTLVWSPPVDGVVLWSDRTMAVVNMTILGRAHALRGAYWMIMLPLLFLVVSLKAVDVWVARDDEVTSWYIAWHTGLFACNAAIALWIQSG